MRVMKGSAVNQMLDKDYPNPCYGNKDTKKEYIIDERNKDCYLVRIATLVELPSGNTTEDGVKYQLFNKDDFYDADFEAEQGNFYAWKEKDVKVLHDPTDKTEVTKIDKRAKDWRDLILAQNKIGTYVK